MRDVTPDAPMPARRSFLKYSGALGAAAAVSSSLAACSAGPESTNDTGGGSGGDSTLTAVIGYGNDGSWDPTQTASAFCMAANNHIYEGLLDTDPISREPYAALATAVPSDLSGTSWKFELRAGATFHDGKPVTADDVVFSFDRVLDTNKKVLTNTFFSTWLNGVTKIDDTTVKISMKFPFASAVQRFSIVKIMPKHIFAAKDGDFLKQGKNAIGSGPFKVKSHQDTSFTSFEEHEGYNGPLKPTFASMQWNVSVDAAARVGLLTSGVSGVQIADNIPQDNIDSLRAKGLNVEGVDSMNLLGLVFNTSKAPFNDKRVRQALRLAIDTQKLIDVSIAGKGTPATSFLHTKSPEYHKAATQYPYNPDKAKALLAEAGVSNLSVTLLSTNISWTKTAVNTIKEGWEAVGVATTLDIQESAAFNSKVASGEPVDALTFSGNPNQFGADADLNIRWFYSNSNTWLPWNKWGETAEFKHLETQLDAAVQSTDQAERQAKTNAALDTIADEAVIYPVMHMQLFTAWDPKKLEGVKALDIPGVNLLKATRTA